eukprot:TRINITY_DN3268_c3_g1_i1.p1 TRINITY_DN3268_c3_g1~~TRINITY_DN3268_c3_g1_i1.p1  ORF type:complete len:952 (+),score=330.01 TRINITY_DN3268_c3_g1_i1:214-2856(+)
MWAQEYNDLQMWCWKGVVGLDAKRKKLRRFVNEFGMEFESTVEAVVNEMHLPESERTYTDTSATSIGRWGGKSLRDTLWVPETSKIPPIELAQRQTNVTILVHTNEATGRKYAAESTNYFLIATASIRKLTVPLQITVRCGGFYVTVSAESSVPNIIKPVYYCTNKGRKRVVCEENGAREVLANLSNTLNLSQTELTGGGEALYGPSSIRLYSTNDGAYVVKNVADLMPVHGQGVGRNVYIRHEAVSDYTEPVSGCSFKMYGLRSHRENDATCKRLAEHIHNTVAKDLAAALENDERVVGETGGVASRCRMISEAAKSKGVGYSGLGHVLRHMMKKDARDLVAVICYGRSAKRVLFSKLRNLPCHTPEQVNATATCFLRSVSELSPETLAEIAKDMEEHLLAPISHPAPPAHLVLEYLIAEAHIILEIPHSRFTDPPLTVSEIQVHIKAPAAASFYRPLIAEMDDNIARKFIERYAQTPRYAVAANAAVQQLMYADGVVPRKENAAECAAILKNVATRVDGHEPLVELSNCFVQYKAWKLAEEYLEKALEVLSSGTSQNKKDIAELTYRLGVIIARSGRTQEATEILYKAMELYKATYGDLSLKTVECYTGLAELYESQGQPDNAEQLRALSLWIRTDTYGKMHLSVSTALNNLAVNLFEQQRYDEAEPLYKLDLEICEKILGPDHEDVAVSLNNLASLYDMKGLFDKSIPLYLRDLEITRKRLGDDHPSTATSLNNLAASHAAQGSHQQALALYEEALSIRRTRHNNTPHVTIAETLNNIGQLHFKMRDFKQSEKNYLEALSMMEQLGVCDNQKMVSLLSNMQALYDETGQNETAEKYGEQLMEYKRNDNTLHETISQYEATRQSSVKITSSSSSRTMT